SSRRRHTRCLSDWSSDVCSSDLGVLAGAVDGEDGGLVEGRAVEGRGGVRDVVLDVVEAEARGAEAAAHGPRQVEHRQVIAAHLRSEERRVGKEWRSRGSVEREKK